MKNLLNIRNIPKNKKFMAEKLLTLEEEQELFNLWKKGRERALKKHRQEMKKRSESKSK